MYKVILGFVSCIVFLSKYKQTNIYYEVSARNVQNNINEYANNIDQNNGEEDEVLVRIERSPNPKPRPRGGRGGGRYRSRYRGSGGSGGSSDGTGFNWIVFTMFSAFWGTVFIIVGIVLCWSYERCCFKEGSCCKTLSESDEIFLKQLEHPEQHFQNTTTTNL